MTDLLLSSQKLVIGITGYARSGKNTVSEFIKKIAISRVNGCSTFEYSFAAPLKKSVIGLMSGLLDEYDDPYKFLEDAKNNNEKVKGIDIRYTLQQLGSICRKQNHDIFAEIMVNKINKAVKYSSSTPFDRDSDRQIFIIPDTRFINEEAILRDAFGDDYILINVDKPEITVKALNDIPPYNHESEQQIKLLTPDKIFKNDGSLEDLKKKIEIYMLKIFKLRGFVS